MARPTVPFTRLARVLFLLLALLGAGFLYLRSCAKPPDESRLINNFYARRAIYERLRDMLLADEQARAIYVRQGVETRESGLPRAPAEVNFPVGRYDEYRALLEQAGSEEVFRTGASDLGICVSVWASGFGGDTRHVDACWLQQIPSNQSASLADFYKTPKPRHPVFRHIDSNWYLWADW
jgi:hypothetical protein